MTIMTGSAVAPSSRSAAFDRAAMNIELGKRFLEQAHTDPWHANIVLQLAESVGDEVDSLSGYIEMLLTNEQAKYVCWFAQLGELERAA